MAETDASNRNLLGNLARLGAGLIVVAAAAARALEARQRADRQGGAQSLDQWLNTRPVARRRGPPEAGITAPAVPPRGPLPLQGGAAARLDFEA
ncbi:MAG: hypothetical protein ACJLS3_05490 [Erythrobacter sp.]